MSAPLSNEQQEQQKQTQQGGAEKIADNVINDETIEQGPASRDRKQDVVASASSRMRTKSPSPTPPPARRGRSPVQIPFLFVSKLYEMLRDCDQDPDGKGRIVSWLPDGKTFKVHQPKAMATDLLPKYFNQSKYKSFQRQLNLWGFDRITAVGPEKGAYFHPSFLRDKPLDVEHMRRVRAIPKVPAKERRRHASTKTSTKPSTNEPSKDSVGSLGSFAVQDDLAVARIPTGHSSRQDHSSTLSSATPLACRENVELECPLPPPSNTDFDLSSRFKEGSRKRRASSSPPSMNRSINDDDDDNDDISPTTENITDLDAAALLSAMAAASTTSMLDDPSPSLPSLSSSPTQTRRPAKKKSPSSSKNAEG